MMSPKTIITVLMCLLCFAGNSLLCRFALGGKLIGPESFTLVRMASGALALLTMVWLRAGIKTSSSFGCWRSASALFVYAALFSFAYLRLDAGLGALILFGCVQLTMIG